MNSETEPINNEKSQTQTHGKSDDGTRNGTGNSNGKERNRNRRSKKNKKPTASVDPILTNVEADGRQDEVANAKEANGSGADSAKESGESENGRGKKSQNRRNKNHSAKPKDSDAVDRNFLNDRGANGKQDAVAKIEDVATAGNDLEAGTNANSENSSRGKKQNRNRRNKDQSAKPKAHVDQNLLTDETEIEKWVEAMEIRETTAPAIYEGKEGDIIENADGKKQKQNGNRGKKNQRANLDAQNLQDSTVKEGEAASTDAAGLSQEGSARSKKNWNRRNNNTKNVNDATHDSQIPSSGNSQIEKQDAVMEKDVATAIVDGSENSGQNQKRKRNQRSKSNKNKNTATEIGHKSPQNGNTQIGEQSALLTEAAKTTADNTGEKNGKNKRNRRNNGNSKRSVHAATQGGESQSDEDTPTEQHDKVTEMINNTTNIAQPNDPLALSLHQFSATKFSTQSSISAPTKRALSEVLHYDMMTKVQEATLPSILQGTDVVAKAKTGSGKTSAFLLPILERITSTTSGGASNSFVSAVVISPTRELTQQIAAEFVKLSTFHSSEKTVYISMIGGTNIDKDKRALASKKNLRLIVATPGRLLDHLKQNTANLVERMSRVQVLCLDEADRLLDMGFRDDLKAILGYMPASHKAGERQTLLFSATFPDSLKEMTDLAMKADHEFIDTLDANESHTNVQVMQKSVVVPLQNHILAMHEVIQSHVQECTSKGQKYKCIVFFTTARIAGFMTELFLARYPEHYSPKNLWEIHSRKSQSHRINVAKQFTAGDNCVLFSSDVSARGVDYPNVSFVLQVGAPSDKAQYIHRLGRTARAGQAGEGVLILCDFERVFLKEVEDLEIMPLTIPAFAGEQAHQEQQLLRKLLESNEKLNASAASSYQAFLGYYNSNVRRLKLRSKQELVQIANEYATTIGFPEGQPPALLAKTVGKMQLKDVPGIRIDRGGGAERGGRGRNNSGGRGGRGGRGAKVVR